MPVPESLGRATTPGPSVRKFLSTLSDCRPCGLRRLLLPLASPALFRVRNCPAPSLIAPWLSVSPSPSKERAIHRNGWGFPSFPQCPADVTRSVLFRSLPIAVRTQAHYELLYMRSYAQSAIGKHVTCFDGPYVLPATAVGSAPLGPPHHRGAHIPLSSPVQDVTEISASTKEEVGVLA